MKVQLKDFQDLAVADLFRHFLSARREVLDGGDRQVIALSSPTGSGKTLMVTALIEQILRGNGQYAGAADTTFLWLSDQPELNEQSRRKILATSTVLGLPHLVTIENTFDQETFGPGSVYFLNTQKLSREALLVTPGDTRNWTIWETISNTIEQMPAHFVLILDEAHKGMGQRPSDLAAAATIVQRFIKGSADEIPGVPLVLGISATPKRFYNVVGGVHHILLRQVDVDILAVRESGLIKDQVYVVHPSEAKGAADWTLLREAAMSWKQLTDQWREYSDRQDLPVPVRPVLVIQVEDASAKQLTKTDLARTIEIIESASGPLPDTALAHCFQEKQPLTVGSRSIRSVAPPDIQDDDDIRIVFFKLSLNTGWDCPRAEVMMSFRRSQDHTSIAQLIGRMVRTPLARRVESDEALNSVDLYLPNYDHAAVHQVVSDLTSAGENQISADVEEGESPPADLVRAPESEGPFALLQDLPTYRSRRTPPMSNIKRLVALGRYLAQDDLRPGALDDAIHMILAVLDSFRDWLANDPVFRRQVEGYGELQVTGLPVPLGAADGSAQQHTVLLEEANLDQLFGACGRRLGEGLHLAYLKHRVTEGTEIPHGKRELLALISRPDVNDRMDDAAGQQVGDWLQQYQPATTALNEEARERYRRIRGTAKMPNAESFSPPMTIQANAAGDDLPKHLYVDPNKHAFRAVLTGWERSVLRSLLRRDDILWWLRNPPRKSWSFSIVFEGEGGQDANMFPDFLVIRRERTGPVVDILEPHRADEGDSARKLRGLATYAARHGDQFGRVLVISKDGDTFRSVDLNDEANRASALAVNSSQSVVQLFRDRGKPVQ